MSEKVFSEMIPFEKYYLRVLKETDDRYLEWIKYANNKENPLTEVTIYGHSLSPFDGDVLREFITADNAVTTVYCRDEVDRREKIKNLAAILGRERFIELASGYQRRVRFEILS